MRTTVWLAVLAAVAVARCGGAAVVEEDPYAVPEGLLIGAGVSAIQTEGAWNEDGKGESGPDHLLHTGKLVPMGFSNDSHQHDNAAMSYHRFKEDVKAAADLGLKLYRFSISWSRLLPDGKTRNDKGVQFYHNLIDEILKYNIVPMATLYHFDHPWILEEQFKGWQSEQMVEYFKTFAKLAFNEYSGKVKLWTTINEPNMYCTYFPTLYVAAGLYKQSDMDYYQCVRNTILAHAEAYHIFQEDGHKGQLGFTALLMTARPNSSLPEDAYAAEAFNEAHAGLVLNPVVYGDYPDIMKELAGSKLQPFTDEEKQRINGTADFIGFNIYYGMVASYTTTPNSMFSHIPVIGVFLQDLPFVDIMIEGLDLAHMMDMYSLVEPDGLRSALLWTWTKYKLPLVITENGFGDVQGLGKKDHIRGVYHSSFLRTLVTTMKEFSVKVIGYCTWSLIDSFEWSAGYSRPFGLVHVDYEGGTLNRELKESSEFWINLARKGSIPVWEANDTTTLAPPATTSAPATTTPSSATAATSATLLLLLTLATNLL